jgi:hypothetical protein
MMLLLFALFGAIPQLNDCRQVRERRFAHLQELPRDITKTIDGWSKVLGFTIENPRAYNASDESWISFKGGFQRGCTITIGLDYGGLARGHWTQIFVDDGHGWKPQTSAASRKSD